MTVSPSIAGELLFRGATADDLSYVISSWLKSYRNGSARAREVPGPVYFDQHHRVASALLGRSTISVVSHRDQADAILAYLVSERAGRVLVVHYAYSKRPFRRLGLASALLRTAADGALGVQHSHETPEWAPLGRLLGSAFNPYLGGLLP